MSERNHIKSADRAVNERALKNISIKRRPRKARLAPPPREAMIAEAAYFRSAHRGFEPGHDMEDWLAAEAEIDGALARGELPVLCG